MNTPSSLLEMVAEAVCYTFKLSYSHSCYPIQVKDIKVNRSVEGISKVTPHSKERSNKKQYGTLFASLVTAHQHQNLLLYFTSNSKVFVFVCLLRKCI